MDRGIKLLLGISCLCPWSLWAGSPFITDDPNPVSFHHIQIIPYTSLYKNSLGSFTNMPGLELDYGVLPATEINVVVINDRNYSNSYLIRNVQGFGDIQLGLKYAFLHETEYTPEVAFAPIYFIPTGDYNLGLGNGRGWELLPLWAQKSWGDWTCYGGGGYAINGAPFMKNYYFGGVVLQKQLNNKWLIGGEVFSQTTSSHFVGPFTLINLGGVYSFSSNLQALFSLGHHILGEKSLIAYLGIQWNH